MGIASGPAQQLPPVPACTACSNRSIAYLNLGSSEDKALADADKAIQLRPDWEKGHFRRGAALAAQGANPSAPASFMAALDLNPESNELAAKVKELRAKVPPERRPKSKPQPAVSLDGWLGGRDAALPQQNPISGFHTHTNTQTQLHARPAARPTPACSEAAQPRPSARGPAR